MEIDRITKDVNVDGQVMEVEYLNFDVGDNPFGIHWTLWDKITIPFYRFRGHCRELRHIIKWAFQRMFRGYDDTETWELYYNFITRYKKILTRYRKKHCGYPGDLTEEEWDAIIDRMIHYLDMMDEQYVKKILCKDMPEDYVPSCATIHEINNRYKDEFFQMFSEWFYNLWD